MQVRDWVSLIAVMEGFGEDLKTLPGFETRVVWAVA
jgi:hypothetical protein